MKKLVLKTNKIVFSLNNLEKNISYSKKQFLLNDFEKTVFIKQKKQFLQRRVIKFKMIVQYTLTIT